MTEKNKILIASEAAIYIATLGDINEALGACFGAAGLILTEEDVAPDFFNLRTGLAGELFQKFTNYHFPLALVVADPAAYGERFNELAYEHRSHRLIRCVHTVAEAEQWLQNQGHR